jgi:hypothetical protein
LPQVNDYFLDTRAWRTSTTSFRVFGAGREGEEEPLEGTLSAAEGGQRVTQGKHLPKHRRGVVGTTLAVAAAVAVVAVAVQFVGPVPARATGGGGGSKTVRAVINVPALEVINLCNADVVNLHGDAYLTVTTTPHRNGGYTVRSSMRAPNLTGERIFPPPVIGYRGDDAENAYSYYSPPPGPSSHRVAHWTKLVPQGNAPTMYLVIVIRETIAMDGTPLVSVERAYLVCKPPSKH